MTKTMFLFFASMFLVAFTATPTNAFSVPSHQLSSKCKSSVITLRSSKGEDDFPKEGQDEYTGSVDWDNEWKKVVEKERSGQKLERPGDGYYKSDAELAAIRAAKKAQTEVEKISNKLPSVPSFDMGSLTGDWKFWIGILVIISIGSAVLSAQPSYTPVAGGDSYYI